MKNFVYLLAVNAIIWAAIFGYVYSLSSRNKEIDRELKAIKEQLKGEGAKGPRGQGVE